VATASLGIAVLALVVSVVAFAGTVRQSMLAEAIVSREFPPLAVLVQINGTWWWRLSNNGARYVTPLGIEWVDVDPPEVAVERESMPWGIPPGGEVFVPALGTPKPGRRISVEYSVETFRWWRWWRDVREETQRAYSGNATVDPTVLLANIGCRLG
jgi:hypothetical protein